MCISEKSVLAFAHVAGLFVSNPVLEGSYGLLKARSANRSLLSGAFGDAVTELTLVGGYRHFPKKFYC